MLHAVTTPTSADEENGTLWIVPHVPVPFFHQGAMRPDANIAFISALEHREARRLNHDIDGLVAAEIITILIPGESKRKIPIGVLHLSLLIDPNESAMERQRTVEYALTATVLRPDVARFVDLAPALEFSRAFDPVIDFESSFAVRLEFDFGERLHTSLHYLIELQRGFPTSTQAFGSPDEDHPNAHSQQHRKMLWRGLAHGLLLSAAPANLDDIGFPWRTACAITACPGKESPARSAVYLAAELFAWRLQVFEEGPVPAAVEEHLSSLERELRRFTEDPPDQWHEEEFIPTSRIHRETPGDAAMEWERFGHRYYGRRFYVNEYGHLMLPESFFEADGDSDAK